MNTNKIIAAAAIGLCSLTALSAWAQTEKYVEISTKGQYITCPASDINYISVFDQLTPPTNVTATYSDGKIHLSWDEVEGATSYNIFYSCDRDYAYPYPPYLESSKAPYEYNVTDTRYTFNVSSILNPRLGGIIYFYISANGEGRRSEFSDVARVTIGESPITVGTLCGYKLADDSQGTVYGPFETASGFNYEGSMAFDPLYPNRLYIAYDGYPNYGEIVQLDLETNTHTLLMSKSKFENKRVRNCAFTKDGQYMLVSTDRDDNGYKSPSVWIVKRNDDGTFSDESSMKLLAAYKQCNCVAVHPVNGEVYFTSYSGGEVFRIDIDNYFSTVNESKEWDQSCFDCLFSVMDPSWEISISIHPSGNYAYLNCINRGCIYRTDYDWNKKKFTTPYPVIGGGKKGFMDGESYSAEIQRPYQGVFVKNSKYSGELDEYDYYFTDTYNFCVRALSPMRKTLRTITGRAPYDDGNLWGTEDGNGFEARFRDITGLAYDENTKTFYVLDHNNRRIRTITIKSR